MERREKELFIDNLLVRVHFIIVMIWWTGFAPFPFPGSRISTFLAQVFEASDGGVVEHCTNSWFCTAYGTPQNPEPCTLYPNLHEIIILDLLNPQP